MLLPYLSLLEPVIVLLWIYVLRVATPVPDPIPVATKVIPTLLSIAPIAIKSVSPTVFIVYTSPILK